MNYRTRNRIQAGAFLLVLVYLLVMIPCSFFAPKVMVVMAIIIVAVVGCLVLWVLGWIVWQIIKQLITGEP